MVAFSGAVLCGGASQRMGTDKALLRIDGVPMAVRVAGALRAAGAVAVDAIGGDAARLSDVGLTVVADDDPGNGPLPATLTALRVARAPIVLVVSCDLLDPDPAAMAATVAALVDAAPEIDGAVPVAAGHHQWTHAAWRRTASASLEAARASGIGSLKRAAPLVRIVEISDLPALALVDADSPADLGVRGPRDGEGDAR